MKKLDEYFKLQKEIYEFFGYEEEWKVYPLDDCTEYYWFVTDSQVWFFDSQEAYVTNDGMHMYSNELYGKNRGVYPTRKYTMIRVDTNTDGNKFLMILDNSKMLPVKEIDY